MQVRLEVSHKSGKKKTVNINSDAVIGRSTECSLRIASSEISRKHCKLTVIESGVLVRDLESANGTWVNGKMIPPARDVALRPGSRLSIGPVQFIVHYESSNPAIDPPGSTVDLPAIRDVPDPNTSPATVDDKAPVEDTPEFVPPDEETDAVETVVVEPDAVQAMLADSFPGDVEDEETVDVAAAAVDDVIVEDEEVAEVEDEAEAEDVESESEAPADKKKKRGSMFGGLLKFGRKSKDKPAAESPATETSVESEAVAEVAETEETVDEIPADEPAPQIAPPAEDEEEYVEEGEEGYDEGEYDEEEYEDEEYEDEEEVDEELGDFFNQFEDK